MYPRTIYMSNTDYTDYTDYGVAFIIWSDNFNRICISVLRINLGSLKMPDVFSMSNLYTFLLVNRPSTSPVHPIKSVKIIGLDQW